MQFNISEVKEKQTKQKKNTNGNFKTLGYRVCSVTENEREERKIDIKPTVKRIIRQRNKRKFHHIGFRYVDITDGDKWPIINLQKEETI
jgi:hypothetical protein